MVSLELMRRIIALQSSCYGLELSIASGLNRIAMYMHVYMCTWVSIVVDIDSDTCEAYLLLSEI